MSKLNYLDDCCNDLKIEPEVLRAHYCNRCMQSECNQSQAGKSPFEVRVNSWEERLFLSPPRMDPSDPRFQQIRGTRKFLDIEPGRLGRIPEIGRSSGPTDWIDARTLTQAKDAPLPVTVAGLPKSTPPPVQVETPQAPPSEGKPAPTLPAIQPRSNTTFKQGAMIGGAKVPEAKPIATRDEWSGPQPAKPGEKIVTTGAKIKFGK